jgi:hypothetical protein
MYWLWFKWKRMAKIKVIFKMNNFMPGDKVFSVKAMSLMRQCVTSQSFSLEVLKTKLFIG